MSFPTLEVEPRQDQGTSRLRRLRAQGKVPGILYGHNDKASPESVQVDERTLRRYLEAGRKFFDVTSASGQHKAYVAEVQVDELTDEILHIDFQRLEAGDVVALKIPLSIKGTPAGARLGGRLEVFLHNIRVRCTPENPIEEFVLDVSDMEIGDRATLGGLKLPTGVAPVGQASTAICIVHPPRGSRGPGGEDAPADGEGGGGEEAPAEGGDTPASES